MGRALLLQADSGSVKAKEQIRLVGAYKAAFVLLSSVGLYIDALFLYGIRENGTSDTLKYNTQSGYSILPFTYDYRVNIKSNGFPRVNIETVDSENDRIQSTIEE